MKKQTGAHRRAQWLAGVFCVLQLSGLPAVAWGHAAHGKPQYGGVVAEAGAVQVELVTKPEGLQFYVTDHGEAVLTQGAKGKLMVVQGSEKQEFELQAQPTHQLFVAVQPKSGSKLVMVLHLPGKKLVQARWTMP